MYYTIYQITNIINGKIYIGAHQTANLDDTYLSSSKPVADAIKKYGKENFKKDVIHMFKDRTSMYLKEAKIVNEEFVKRKDTYNIKPGGLGGFYHINNNPEKRQHTSMLSSMKNKGQVRHRPTAEEKEASKIRNKKMYELGIGPYSKESKEKCKQLVYSEEKRRRLRAVMKGKNNGMFGSAFYVNMDTNEKRRFLKNEIIPDGWVTIVQMKQSTMKKNWYHDDTRNFLVDKDDERIQAFNWKRGRLK